jgi:hypothetical protein
MWRVLLIAFLLAHAGIHVAVWASPVKADAPFDPGHSWLFGTERTASLIIAVVTAAVIAAAGVGLWAHAEWWRSVAVAGLSASFGLMVVWFTPWFVFIEGVNAALLLGIALNVWPSQELVGA